MSVEPSILLPDYPEQARRYDLLLAAAQEAEKALAGCSQEMHRRAAVQAMVNGTDPELPPLAKAVDAALTRLREQISA